MCVYKSSCANHPLQIGDPQIILIDGGMSQHMSKLMSKPMSKHMSKHCLKTTDQLSSASAAITATVGMARSTKAAWPRVNNDNE